MPVILLVGPFVALLGIVAVVFVLRRKSVDKRSMYSARRSQIEHKVRAARQRTLIHGRGEKAAETTGEPAPTSNFAPAQSAPQVTYEASAYEAPPAAPPPMTKGLQEAPSPSPWDVGPTSTPSSPFVPQEQAPPLEPTFDPAPSESVWTPAAPPAEPASPVAPLRPASPAAAPAAWSVVSEAKESASTAEDQPKKKGKGKQEPSSGAWQLASGDAPGSEPDEVIKAPGQTVAIAQYAVLVVGLVAVLIGVLIMVASSPIK